MTEEEARTRLERMVAASVEPLLTSDELEDLLADAARSDRYEGLPGERGYVPTWDLNAAAAAGWEQKAGKLSNQFDLPSNSRTPYALSQVTAHCMAQAEMYRSRIASSAPARGATRARSYANPNSDGGYVE